MVWLMAKVILELRDMSDITRKMADAQEKGERPCPCKRCLELERKVASRELHVKQLLDEIDHLRTEIAARDGY
jgi:methylphosphotriester-DNA--protein-cysteine methyltransferase